MKGMSPLLAALGGSCRHRITTTTWGSLVPSTRNLATLRGLAVVPGASASRASLTPFPRTWSWLSSTNLSFTKSPASLLFSRAYSVKDGALPLVGPRKIQPRFFSANSTFQAAVDNANANTNSNANSNANSAAAAPPPVLSPPAVGRWLMLCSLLALGVIVVGGVTRLTESGLSITEWRPVTGVLPPLSQAEWDAEFTKYKATPEFKILNSAMTLDDFKRIFYMEWGHRVLGRVVGLAFVLPLTYYAARGRLTAGLAPRLLGIAALLGLQGALGWYMVQSGLDAALLDAPGAVPRVSQYRLAAHLGAAVVLYAAMFATGHAIMKDWRFARTGAWSGLPAARVDAVLRNPLVRRFRTKVWALMGLVFLTAISGAFVAGLDAGLLYNEFPLMGGRLAPPTDELLNPAYAVKSDKSDLWWRNVFENPTTVQFDHRVLALTTYFSTAALYGSTVLNPALKAALPVFTKRVTAAAFGIANVQVLLGISTLLYLVPVPLAAAHQAGSIFLLSSVIALAMTLRRPGAVAQIWRKRKLLTPS